MTLQGTTAIVTNGAFGLGVATAAALALCFVENRMVNVTVPPLDSANRMAPR